MIFYKKTKKIGIISIAIMICLFMTSSVCFGDNSASNLIASGRVNSKGGAYLRKTASVKGKQVKLLKNNAKLTIKKEVFTNKKKSQPNNKWYYVSTSKGKKGYIRSDLVDTVKYTEVKGQSTTDDLRYRYGAGTEMKIKNTFKNYDLMNLVLKAYPRNSNELWYKIRRGKKYYYVCASFVTTNIKEKPSEEQLLEEEIARVKKIKSINDMALALAWPYGTTATQYTYGTGSALPVYTAIMSEYPNRTKDDSYGGCPKAGASCDRYAGCVIWACGADADFPSGCQSQWTYMDNHPEKWMPIQEITGVDYTGDTSALKPGDVIIYKKAKDSYHTLLIVKNPAGSGIAIAEAQLLSPRSRSTYPHINTSLSKISTSKVATYKGIKVYRLVK